VTTNAAPIERIDHARQAPDVFRTMPAFSRTAAKGLDPVVAELVKIRASQFKGCAFRTHPGGAK
jgi:alkylhydroperoxidase family enzyme